MKKTTIITILAIILILGGIVWFARPSSQNNSEARFNDNMSDRGEMLIVDESNNFDFGEISMAAGNVKHAFKIKNISAKAIVINKIYTSCMCTTASLVIKGKIFGPYGMPGHGAISKINQTINPSEEANVEVIFDPAAHGPAGVGRIQRAITIENNAGEPIELIFSAVVIP